MTTIQIIKDHMFEATAQAKVRFENNISKAKVWVGQNIAPHSTKIAATTALLAAAALSALALKSILTNPSAPDSQSNNSTNSTNSSNPARIDCDYYLANQYVLEPIAACANYSKPVFDMIKPVIEKLNSTTDNQTCSLSEKPRIQKVVEELTSKVNSTLNTTTVVANLSTKATAVKTNLSNLTNSSLNSSNVLRNDSASKLENLSNESAPAPTTAKTTNSLNDEKYLDPDEFLDMKLVDLAREAKKLLNEHQITLESSAAGATAGTLTALVTYWLTSPFYRYNQEQTITTPPTFDPAQLNTPVALAAQKAVETLANLATPVVSGELIRQMAYLEPLKNLIDAYRENRQNLKLPQGNAVASLAPLITELIYPNAHGKTSLTLTTDAKAGLLNLILNHLKKEYPEIAAQFKGFGGVEMAEAQGQSKLKELLTNLQSLIPKAPQPVVSTIHVMKQKLTAFRITVIATLSAVSTVVTAIAAQRFGRI